MKQNWLAFKNQNWDKRSAQERNALKLLAWVLTPVLLYFILWQPAHDAVKKLHISIPPLNMQADKLRRQANEVDILRHRPKPAMLDAVAMKAAVEESAERNGMRAAIATLDLQQPNGVRISFTSVAFEQWLRWLQAMQQEQHIRAESVSVSMLSQPGMVKLSATLVNGGTQ